MFVNIFLQKKTEQRNDILCLFLSLIFSQLKSIKLGSRPEGEHSAL